MSFYYHMWGSDMGTLRVGQFLEEEGEEEGWLVGEIQGNRGNHWNKAIVPLQSVNKNFQIYFEGVIGRQGNYEKKLTRVSS